MARTPLLSIAVTAILIVGGCSNSGGTRGAVGTGGAGADVQSDPDFVRDVALKNMSEIELSRMALARASSPEVKVFAQMMADDHGAAAEKLKTIVAGQPIEWPAQLDDKHRKTVEELTREQGADFDREYLEAMVEAHQNLAAKLESRLDVKSLSDWKTAAAGRTQSQAMPDPAVAMRDVAVRPAPGGTQITTKINQWAADTYPLAQKHLDSARALENAGKKSSTR